MTYEMVTKDNNESAIISRHVEDRNIRLPSEMRKLPCIYWLPKLHKNPFDSRFIAASKKCTTKPLSKAYLTTITIHFKEYCVGIFKNTGINCYWILNNSQQVLDHLSI